MSREVKFRGSKGDGTWYIGDFITDNREFNRTCDKAFILPHWDKLNCPISVEPKSVGQFTGLKDKNGCEIYEGDIVNVPDEEEPLLVKFIEERAAFVFYNAFKYYHWNFDEYKPFEVEIIGNKFEDPEILGEFANDK